MATTRTIERTRHHRTVTASPRRAASVYRRRRLVSGTGAIAVVTMLLSVATGTLAVPGGVPASASGDSPALVSATLVARPGDTLWSIAAEHRGNAGHARYVDLLVRVNGGASIAAGQVVVLP